MIVIIDWSYGIFVICGYLLYFVRCTDVSNNGDRSRRWVSLSAEEKQAIVDKHNDLRRKEGAADMIKLKWNEELAELGERWAQRCHWGHGQPGGEKRSLGQNLYISTWKATPESSVRGIQGWYDEKKDYSYWYGCSRGKVCGHYTQIVWAASREVGCGYHVCPTIQVRRGQPPWRKAYYLVCNYSPPGNYVGEKPYKKGYKCSSCPETAKFCDNALCSETKPQNSGAPLLCGVSFRNSLFDLIFGLLLICFVI